MFNILTSAVILIFLRFIMSSQKFGFFGNVLAYTILSTLMAIFISGFSISFLLVSFIAHFILGILLIYVLTIVDDRGDWKYFIIVGIIAETLISWFVSWILNLFM